MQPPFRLLICAILFCELRRLSPLFLHLRSHVFVNHALPKSTRQILEQTQRIGVQFLLTDMSAALTFLDVADVTQSPGTRQRNRDHALSAYKTVLRLLSKISPSDDERSALHEKLQVLKNRLLQLGYLLIEQITDTPEPGNRI